MIKKIVIVIAVILIIISVAVIFGSKKVNISHYHMQISSSAFKNAEKIPSKYTCDGADIIPPLEISGVPAGTQSLSIIMDDPDSPSGDFLHWTAWNIIPEKSKIQEGKVPVGVIEGKTGFGKAGYGGPCPGQGEHRYFFRVFALDKMLNLPAGADRKSLESAMSGHVLEQAEFYGLYKRVGR